MSPARQIGGSRTDKTVMRFKSVVIALAIPSLVATTAAAQQTQPSNRGPGGARGTQIQPGESCPPGSTEIRPPELLESHQLPVLRILRKGETGFRARPIMASLERRVSPNSRFAPNAAPRHSRLPQQGRTDALALPAVIDRQPKLETVGIGVEGIAGFADDVSRAVDGHHPDHAETVALADMNELLEYGLRQFAMAPRKRL